MHSNEHHNQNVLLKNSRGEKCADRIPVYIHISTALIDSLIKFLFHEPSLS